MRTRLQEMKLVPEHHDEYRLVCLECFLILSSCSRLVINRVCVSICLLQLLLYLLVPVQGYFCPVKVAGTVSSP